jgi:hypothetical protein
VDTAGRQSITGKGSGATAGSIESAGPMMVHLLKFRVLVGRKDCFKAVVAGHHQGMHLLTPLPRKEVVVLVYGLGLVAEVLLAGFDLGYLVIGKVEVEPESFETGSGHHLAILIHPFTACGEFGLLLGGQEGLEFRLLFFFEGKQIGLVLLQSDIVLFEEVSGFLAIFIVDCGDLLALFGGVVDEVAMLEAAAALTEAVLAGTMEGEAVGVAEFAGVSAECAGGAVETVEGRVAGVCRIGPRGLGVRGPAEG